MFLLIKSCGLIVPYKTIIVYRDTVSVKHDSFGKAASNECATQVVCCVYVGRNLEREVTLHHSI